MTPLFFRGSILIAEQVLSYSDFMNMNYRDFKRIEATHSLMTNLKNGVEYKDENSKEETKEQLSKLDSIHVDDIDLPPIYKEIF